MGHCYLENLSPELLFPILTYLPDLESLDSLLRVSAAAYRLFDLQGATIFKVVLSSGSTHKYSSALICIIALIRSAALPPDAYDLASFIDLVIHETTPHRYDPPRWIYNSSRLPLDMSATVLRGLLATNRRVQRLAFGCLEYYLDRFRSLRPYHPADFTFDSTHWHWGSTKSNYIGPWQLKPANTLYYYPVRDVGPPSWLEQQRAIRAFWRVQLFHELATAVDTSRIILPVEEGEKGLSQMKPADLYNVPLWYYTSDRNMKSRLVVPPTSDIHESDERLELQLIESTIDYTKEVREVINDPTYWRLKKDWKACSMPGSKEDREILDRCWTSNMWYYFYNLSRPSQYHNTYYLAPLQYVEFVPFRRLGFAFWSTTRLVEYGLLLPHQRHLWGYERPYFEAWKSILPQDERDKMEKLTEQKKGLIGSYR